VIANAKEYRGQYEAEIAEAIVEKGIPDSRKERSSIRWRTIS
jgi:hypothetical protein